MTPASRLVPYREMKGTHYQKHHANTLNLTKRKMGNCTVVVISKVQYRKKGIFFSTISLCFFTRGNDNLYVSHSRGFHFRRSNKVKIYGSFKVTSELEFKLMASGRFMFSTRRIIRNVIRNLYLFSVWSNQGKYILKLQIFISYQVRVSDREVI